ncbi:MAG: ATP-binding protein [Gammaproteobacteria bacterium]
MIAASLLAISASTVLLLDYLRDGRDEAIRAQGVGLIRVLSALPYDELVPSSNPSAVMRTLQMNEGKENFAFASIVGVNAKPVVEVVAPGLIVPSLIVPNDPAGWLGQRTIPKSETHTEILEYYAPLLSDGELAGYLRLGYFKPGFGISPALIVFAATLALIIFLLTPLFYFLVRREIQPLEAAGSQLRDLLKEGQLQSVDVTASGELGQFMANFNQFVAYANERVASVEADRERVLTSTKLLSYRKERILRVIESFPEGILLLNEAGAITIANSQFEHILGVQPGVIVGSESMDWCKQEDVLDYLNLCRVGGRYLPEAVEFVAESSPDKTFVITAYPLFKPDGSETIGCLVVIRDITIEVLARKGRAEFVAHVAHELKTPLNVLSLYSQSLQDAAPDDEETRIEAANVIEEEVGRLSSLINNMLNITRIEMGSQDVETQRVRIRDLLEDVFNNAKLLRQAEGLNFDIRLPAQVTPLELDKDLIRIALNNFLTNAVKYNKPGGSITMTVEEHDEIVRISVADTGIGIKPEDLSRIFEKFYRSEENEVRDLAGHGLGLALARDIIELHNGSVSVESTQGEGTTFVIDLWKVVPVMKQVG